MSDELKIGANRNRGNAGKGRPKGSMNKATADVKAAAQAFTAEAVETLASIMRASESDAARVAAANAILDRGHGKPKQSIDADVKASITEIRRTLVDNARNPDS
jgi:hypothetical protein